MDSTRHNETRPLRVGHVLTSVWTGGLESFVLSLAVGSRKTFDSRVYSWTGDDTWLDEFRRQGIPVVPIGGPKRLARPLDVVRFCSAWLRLARRLRQDRIDILHTHDFLPSFVGRTASFAAGVPARVATLHNLYGWWPRWAHFANRFLAPRTEAITCVSESVRDFISDRERIPKERLIPILNGVDENRFRPDREARLAMRAELGIGEHDILIGSVGSITTRKAHWILVEGAAPLLKERPDLQIRIWGMNTSNPQHAESDLVARIKSHGLEDRVKILPPRQDIERVYNAMDIHCMTSTAEGLSLASVEAMMCGILPVYSDIGPFREVVSHKETGLLFRSGEPASLEQALREILPSIRDCAMSVAIRDRTVERFGLSRMIRQYTELYRSISCRTVVE